MISHLSIFLIAGLSFVVLPFGSSWHEIPKVFVAWGTIVMIVSGYFWQIQRPLIFPFIMKIVTAGILILCLFSLLFLRTPTTLFGNAFRLQGIVMQLMLLLSFIVLPQTIRRKEIQRYIPFSLVVLLITTIIGISDSSGRSVGPVGEANSLGAIAVFLWSLTTWQERHSTKQTTLWWIYSLCMVIIVFLSGSRSSLIGLIGAGILYASSSRIGLTKASSLAALCLVISLIFPFFQQPQVFDSRTEIWNTALEAGTQRPLFGWGIGNVEQGLASGAKKLENPLRFQYVDSSHNVFLDWWVQGGTVGVTLFSMCVGYAFIGLVRKKERALLMALVGLVAVMLFNPVSVAVLVPFWWLLGVGCVASGSKRATPSGYYTDS